MYRLENMALTNARLKKLSELSPRNENELIKNLCRRWRDTVGARYSILVLDFDGTLRDISDRTGPVDSRIIREIKRIHLMDGVKVYLATGRRSSAYTLARNFISQGITELNFILGNGAEIVSFPSEKIIYSVELFKPSEVNSILHTLKETYEIGEKNIWYNKKMFRIFLDSLPNFDKEQIYRMIESLMLKYPDLNITHSGVNIEIVPHSAKKENAIFWLLGNKSICEVLVVGDSGHIYGNDYGMLSIFPSFCVGSQSNEYIGWTLPVINEHGKIITGPMGTLYLLKNIVESKR